MKRNLGLTMAATLGAVFAPVNADVIYVDDNAASGGDGLTWLTAHQNPLAALAQAVAGDEIRVAGGAYSAGASSFTLLNGVALRGGYRGLAGGGNPDDRNLSAFVSRLRSGSYHIVDARGVSAATILDGFDISGGFARDDVSPYEWENELGAAIYAVGGAPTILSCRFANNLANEDGGAIYGGSGLIDGCQFLNNTAYDFGGAIYSGPDAGWEIRNSEFRNNFGYFGGAVSGCRDVVNCLFEGGRGDYGSAIYGGAHVINCTFYNHERGPFGCVALVDSVRNCILWNNEGSLSSPSTTSNSCIEGWSTGGVGNISVDPQFRDPDGADNIPGNADDDFRLATGSPCIDAGDNGMVPAWSIDDLLGDPRFADDKLAADTGLGTAPIVDMGTYEVNRCFGDITGDFAVDLNDLAVLLAHMGELGFPPYAHGNLNEDRDIGLPDLALLLQVFGTSCR